MKKNTDLTKATTAQLWQMFREGIATSASGLMAAALAWKEMERRGIDLTKARTPLTNRLTAVADGKLAAAVLLRYGHSATVLDNFLGVDLDKQSEMANADYRVAVVKRDGASTMLRPDDLSVSEFKRVFQGGRVQTVAEQKKAMPKPTKPVVVPERAARTSTAILKPSGFSSATPTNTALANAAGFAWLGLTRIQIVQVLEAAENYGMTPAQLVVQTLQDAGIFEAEVPRKNPNKTKEQSRGRRSTAAQHAPSP